MDEIALLQQQLAAVQQQESALKLSDHNVIDLLGKLQQLGRLQVVHTLTGKQFLTPAQLERELRDFVALGGGRASISELQQLLNVDRVYVERHAAQLARSSRRGGGTAYFLVNDGEELVTSGYLDAIMEDTNTLLQETGTATIGELAQQFGFAVEYMKDVVLARLGVILHAQERNNVLYTHSFVASQKAQIRGVFCAATRPTFVPDVVRAHRFEERVVDECLQELLQRRVLMGTLRGREYVPYVFIEAQRESMYSFFQHNGYLDHARALQLQVARPYDFLKRRFPDAVPLAGCVVSQALYLQVEGAVEAAANDASFVDVRTLVPSAILPSDVAMLLSKCPAVATDAFQISDVFAVSRALVDAAVAKLQADAATKATKAAAASSSSVVQQRTAASQKEASAAPFDDDDDDSDDGGRRGGKRGKKGAKQGDEDRKTKRGGGKASKGDDGASSKSKGGKGKNKSKKGDDAVTGSKRQNAASSSGGGAASIAPSREELVALLATWFPLLEDEDELLDGVADHLEAQVDAMYATALNASLSSIIRGDAASLRELRKKFEDKFDDLLSLLLVLEKGFNKLEMHVDAKNAVDMAQLKAVEDHVLRTAGAELASLVTSFVAESNNLEMDDVPSFSGTRTEGEQETPDAASRPTAMMTNLSDNNKKVLESALPGATASALVRLWTFSVAGRRSLSDFMLHIPVLADSLSMPLRKMDRKKERQVIFGYRHAVVGDLELVEDTNVAPTVALLLQLLFQQSTGLPATFPKDSVAVGSMVLNAFRAAIPAAPMAKLDALVALAQELSESASSADDARARGWTELVEEVRALVLAKDIASA